VGIRLVKESTALSNGQSGEYVGNDGKIYPTICINGREWLAANLAETMLRKTYAQTHGRYYNWWVINDSRGIAKSGWRVADYQDWYNLMAECDSGGGTIYDNDAGYVLKSGDTDFFYDDNGGDNSREWNGYASGGRLVAMYTDPYVYYVAFETDRYYNSYWWIAGLYDADSAAMAFLGFASNTLTVAANDGSAWSGNDKKTGGSIRLVKGSTTLSEGEHGTYVANDGTVHDTVCIGGVEWLAQNLNETKFNNGQTIPVVTDLEDWADLDESPATCVYQNWETAEIIEAAADIDWLDEGERPKLCAFNNDWSYVEGSLFPPP